MKTLFKLPSRQLKISARLNKAKAKAVTKPTVSLSQHWQSLTDQFRGLNTNEPGQWPLAPRLAAWVVVAGLAVLLIWLATIREQMSALSSAQEQELSLREDYRSKLVQAVNIETLQIQKMQVESFVLQLEKQLPSKAEMAALLSDINQSGISQGLKFQLFRPGQEEFKDYYAELPIAIRVTGKYDNMGRFASELANLSRIVTLEKISITPVTLPVGSVASKRTDNLANVDLLMEATARTYRYLDTEEVAAQRQAKAKQEGGQK